MNYSTASLCATSRVFHLLAHPLRLKILLALGEGESDDRMLRESLGRDCATTLRSHLDALCGGGMVARRLNGRAKHYRLTSAGQTLLGMLNVLQDDRADRVVSPPVAHARLVMPH